MFGGNDSLDLASIHRAFNVVASPRLAEDAQKPGLLSYYISFKDSCTGVLKPNPENIDILKQEMRDLDFDESLLTEDILRLLNPENGKRTVVLLIRAPRGSPHLSVYRFEETQILNDPILLGDLPETQSENSWFSDRIKLQIFEDLVENPGFLEKMKTIQNSEICLLVHDEQSRTALFLTTFDKFKYCCQQRLLSLEFLNRVQAAFNSKKRIIVFAMENYMIWYPMLITYEIKGDKFIWVKE